MSPCTAASVDAQYYAAFANSAAVSGSANVRGGGQDEFMELLDLSERPQRAP